MTSSGEEPEALHLLSFAAQLRNFSDVLLDGLSRSMSGTSCSAAEAEDFPSSCRDDLEAYWLKMAAIVAILLAGVVGVALPLLGRKRRYLRTDSIVFSLAKAFAAGVILATGFVHMLQDGQEALSNPCLPRSPWSQFPFPGFIAMLAALGTLVLDFVATQFYERKQLAAASVSSDLPSESVPIMIEHRNEHGEQCGKEEMHIVGMRAHAAAHNHSRDGHGHGHGHAHGQGGDEYEGGASSHSRHVVVSQILELGIVSHSVIIGLSLGVSSSPCTIRPLIGALTFHQFFEGLALGGCISQAQFSGAAPWLMAGFFAVTTPGGIAGGAAAAGMYDPNSPRALAVEGVLDCVSAGILIYMALVDLIAADFLSRRMSCDVRVQVSSYLALFLGAASMSVLAIWA